MPKLPFGQDHPVRRRVGAVLLQRPIDDGPNARPSPARVRRAQRQDSQRRVAPLLSGWLPIPPFSTTRPRPYPFWRSRLVVKRRL
jgi:hypothetical protein